MVEQLSNDLNNKKASIEKLCSDLLDREQSLTDSVNRLQEQKVANAEKVREGTLVIVVAARCKDFCLLSCFS